jgi:hypothetical protein
MVALWNDSVYGLCGCIHLGIFAVLYGMVSGTKPGFSSSSFIIPG